MTTVREYKKAFAREVQHWPQADITFTHSTRHQKLIISYRGMQSFCTFASTDSDHRALKNSVADIGAHFASEISASLS
ncbi:MAG: hypothetical protein CMF17_00850 [Idiomarinaceae bacterium]|nr:hypothetical protein [Idiomarinaceae bacterium]|tara:strand:- start:1037 stop:1270 length:234 start_codon:yes stop_codon:yes gene_type:complete